MLLVTEALLLMLATLGQDHRAAGVRRIYPLDMALNSVDDEYDGCTVKMANLVKTKYLEKELNNSTDFKKAWQEGEVNATPPEDKLTRNHSIAIYVYTNFNSSVYSKFNMAVRNGKQNYTDQTFQWYSLHFLLTDAIKILTETQKKCKSTYRGTTVEFYKNVTGKNIRFGSFTSSSLERKVAQRFGNKSCFEIKTCEGANVIKYSKYPEQKEVLIPPYEKFKVTAVKTRRNQKNLWCETVYKLESSGTRSDLNCAVALKKTAKFTKNTSGIKALRFCRCFYRKIQAIAQAVNEGHYTRIQLGQFHIIEPNKMWRYGLRELHTTDEYIYSVCMSVFKRLLVPLLSPTDGVVYIDKRRCHQFLYSQGFDPLILELIKPCCNA